MQPDDCKKAFFLARDARPGTDDRKWLERHLATCPRCREDLRRMAALADLVAKDPVPEPAPGEVERYIASLPPKSSRPRAAGRWIRRHAAPLAAAASVLSVFSVGLWLRRVQVERTRKGQHKQRVPKSAPSSRGIISPQAQSNEDDWSRGCPSRPMQVQGRWKALDCPPSGHCPRLEEETKSLPDDAWRLDSGKSPLRLASAQGKVLLIAGPNTEIRRVPGPGWRLRLVRGKLYASVDHASRLGRCLRIDTTPGWIRIEGTRFLVTTDDDKVTIGVYEGKVRFASRKGPAHAVTEGRQLSADGAGRVRIDRLPDSKTRDILSLPTWAQEAVRPENPRKKDRDGKSAQDSACSLKRLRILGRKSPRQASSQVAGCLSAGRLGPEGSMLQAELELELHQAAKAARIYHQVASRHKGRPIGQDALFAAGQVELTRLARPAKAVKTFHTYLRWYPSGRYAKDVQRVLAGIRRSKAR